MKPNSIRPASLRPPRNRPAIPKAPAPDRGNFIVANLTAWALPRGPGGKAPIIKPIIIELPLPPSLNHYYRISYDKRTGHQRLSITPAGKNYRHTVAVFVAAARHPRIEGRLFMSIRWAPPDRRERDIDNLEKPLLDALQRCGVYDRDSQIDTLHVDRGDPVKGGAVTVKIMKRTSMIARLLNRVIDRLIERGAP
jgi:crossover junction endodeoxyribonuclease RusA